MDGWTDGRERVALAVGAGGEPGEFEILAISAGMGNGWQFTRAGLRASLPLWDGVECFIDHAGGGAPHSLRDLAGVLRAPEWDEALGGIRARLKAFGPGAALLDELGRQMLQDLPGPRPRVGFSADLLFKASGRVVEQVIKVLSVDLVFNPARGGAFLRALNQQEEQGEGTMTDESKTGAEEVRQSEAMKRREEISQVDLISQEVRACLLETALLSAKLPQPLAARVRAQFSGRAFEPSELARAVEDARALASDLGGGAVVAGLGRVSAVHSGEDRLQMAVEDLLGAPRDPGKENVKVERLSGIRELYLTLTGDDDLHGGWDPRRARLATTADFTGLVKNALNKVVAQRWAELGRAGYDWWQKIVTIEHCASLNDITGILVGTVGDLPAVAEGAEYTELPVGDSAETGAFTKYGGYIPLTLELIDRDETRRLREYPRALAAAGIRKISRLVSEVFTAAGGTGPLMADGGRLFNATAVTTAGGHKNLLTTALSASEWDVVCTAVYNQPLLTRAAGPYTGVGPRMAINPRYLLVPRNLQLAAMKILYPSLENTSGITSENQQRGLLGDVITVPEWTDPTDWAAACDPAVAPAVFIGERFGLLPEIYIAGAETSPAVFMNDEHRLKVRHFLSVFVADYRPLHKSNVAG